MNKINNLIHRSAYVSGCVLSVLYALIIVSSCQAFSASLKNSGVVYVSPSIDAQYILPKTTIAIRLDSPVPETGIDRLYSFDVFGSLSGKHSGSLTLANDKKTFIFNPYSPFAWGEEVVVRFSSIDEANRSTKKPLQYSFHIAPSESPKPFSSLGVEAGSPLLSPFDFPKKSPIRMSPLGDTLPLDFPYISTQILGTTSPGYLFLSNFRFVGDVSKYLLILNDSGVPIFYKSMPDMCLDFKVQPNRLLTYFDGTTEKYYAMDSTFAIVDSFSCGNGYTTDLHELEILPNGHALLMSYDPQPVDMRSVVSGGDSSATVIGLVIQELDATKNVVFQWRSWDHFEITDATHENLTASRIDYVHGNAIDLDSDGNIIFSSRHLDEITKIDRTTGDVIWRWGGKHNEFTFIDDSIGFSHQHAIRKLSNGHYTLYDNGNFHTPPFSRGVEYELDQVNKTARLVWQYQNTPPIFGSAMGYVQRLPSGNTIVSWGSTNPNITEVDSNGVKVFEMTFDAGVYTYRGFRFDWLPAYLSNHIEIPTTTSLTPNYPNPFNAGTKMTVNLSRPSNVFLALYDVLGNNVLTIVDHELRSAGIYNVSLDLSRFPTGVYFCRLLTEYNSETRKLLLVR